MRRKVIFDTDMGVDCDDAAAFAILLNKYLAGEVDIVCVTASSTREGATATIKAIADYYKVSLPIGAMAQPALPCDRLNTYGKAVKDFYGIEDVKEDAVSLLRRSLSALKEKCTAIVVGPLCNMVRLLKSGADEISPSCGEELFREKISEVYCMGGNFDQNRVMVEQEGPPFPEWNILQDIPSAQYFAEHCPVGVTFVPWETGAHVMTVMGRGDNPVWECMRFHAISWKFPYEPSYERMSWDPITCLCATEDCGEYFDYSPFGKVTVDGDGRTFFSEKRGGKHRILLLKEGYARIADRINSSIEPIRGG